MGRLKFLGICAALCLFAAVGLCFQPKTAARAADGNIPATGGDLDAGVYTLNEDVRVNRTLSISGDVTIDLNGHTLSLTAGKSGSVLSVMSGSLTLKNGAEQEGSVKNGDSATGGGVYVGGELTLSGNVLIKDNLGSNIFLSNKNKLKLENFTGQAGVSMAKPGEFTDDEVTEGTFFSDDRSYTVKGRALEIAPLSSITAELSGEEKIFPTTSLAALKDLVTVAGINENGVAYKGEMSVSLSVVLIIEEETDKLSLGANTVRVTARGEGHETAETTLTVTAVKPELLSLSAEYKQSASVYFDTPLQRLVPELTVKGVFEDGLERTLFHESEQGGYEESYITEKYALEGDLNEREDSLATVKACVGEHEAEFSVEVSKYVVTAEELPIEESVTILEGEYPAENAFTRRLPAGVTAEITWDGEPLMDVAATLPADFYTVEISFSIDEKNYEPITGTRQATLTVNRASFLFVDGDFRVIFTKAGGFAPDFEFECEEIDSTPKLEEDADAKGSYRITLRQKGEVVLDAGDITVDLLLPENLRGKAVKLYRVLENGETIPMESESAEGHLLFHASNFAYTEYVIAVEGNFPVYLIFTILFGAACLGGAGVLIWYFVVKRKMKIKES